MIVLKFGGTSVGSAKRMMQVAELIQHSPMRKIVVLSAVSGTTNALVDISGAYESGKIEEAYQKAEKLKSSYFPLIEELYSSKEYKEMGLELINFYFDEINRLIKQPYYNQVNKVMIVQGELISTHLFSLYLEEKKITSKLLPATDFMYLNEYGEPDLQLIRTRLSQTLAPHKAIPIFITQGFICRNQAGGIDNLKRGGSDYSATLIGAALSAKEVQIWTDIDGMHNNDPRIVEKTRPISHLSFEEAGELAYFGAKILHPNCIIPAQQTDVPVRIKNTMNPEAEGTFISSEQSTDPVKAIAAKDGITAIKIKSSRMIMAYGFLRKVFEVFEKFKTPIDMITTSEIAVSLTIDDPSHLSQIVDELVQYGKVEVDKNQTIICIVGDMVAEHKGVGGDIFKALSEVPLRMISYGGSRNNISILVETKYKNEALKSLNAQLFNL